MNGFHPVCVAVCNTLGNTCGLRKIPPSFNGLENLLDDGHRVFDPVFIGQFHQCGQRDFLLSVSKYRRGPNAGLQTQAAGCEVVGGADIKRWTARRKAAAVMDLIKGETSASELARTHDHTVAEVEQWMDDFISIGTEALRSHQRERK